jgi:hypothetical protein
MNIDLAEVERIAAAGFTPRQVAFMLGISPTSFETMVKNEESDASIAYYKGLLTAELAVRESVMQLARSGSSPAQASSLKIFDETKRQLTKDGFVE